MRRWRRRKRIRWRRMSVKNVEKDDKEMKDEYVEKYETPEKDAAE
jgi:hypothetical protein